MEEGLNWVFSPPTEAGPAEKRVLVADPVGRSRAQRARRRCPRLRASWAWTARRSSAGLCWTVGQFAAKPDAGRADRSIRLIHRAARPRSDETAWCAPRAVQGRDLQAATSRSGVF